MVVTILLASGTAAALVVWSGHGVRPAPSALAATPTDAPSEPGTVATGVPPSKQPNIVMIVVDDMRADELQYLPHVRRLLVDRGTTFTHALSPHPLCCPARAEMVTGEYAQNNGVHHNVGPYGGFPALIDPDNNLGVWLQKAGYWTGFVGKFLNDYTGAERVAGWDMWKAAIKHVYEYDRVQYFGGPVIKGYAADTTTRFTNRAIDEGHRSGKPFYVVGNYLAPHDTVTSAGISLPVPAPRYAHACDDIQPDYLTNPAFETPEVNGLPSSMQSGPHPPSDFVTESRARICALRSVDDGIATIIENLKVTGELADTDIVFVSDNGFNLGEHLLHGKNWLTDESLDVPVVAAGPDFPVDREESVPISLVDLPATYLQLAGGVPGRTQDGLSILDLIGARTPPRDTMLIQTGDAIEDSTPGFAYRGVTTARYLYAIDPSDPSVGLLQDRRADPHALVNVFDDARYADVRAALQQRLEALMGCSGSDCNQTFGTLPAPRG
ncbi:hypothetical protein GCM10027076_27380 [Nocardioides montaniterrae]